MTGEQFRRNGISAPSSPVAAAVPAPNELSRADLQDGRLFGNELWAMFTSEAHSADAAAKVSAVNFCVSIIAESVGSLSLDILDRADEIVSDFYLGDLLAYAPNPLQTGAEFWSSMAYRAALGGHAFAEPVLNPAGDVEIWALDPALYDVDWKSRGFRLQYTEDGRTRTLGPSDLFWFSGLADSRLKPLTPWRMAQGPINFALALESQGREFFKNGTRLGGALESEKKIDEKDRLALQAAVDRWRSGKIPVLEQGLKLTALTATNVDSQLAELIKQRTLEMARYWRIPRSMIGEDGAGKSSEEQDSRQYVKYTIRPWVRRIEQAITQRLMTPDQRRQYRAKFNVESLQRGDSATQIRNAVMIRNMAAGSVNDIRSRILGWPKIDEDWADNPREPMNSNRAADTVTGGETSPQDKVE